MYPSLVLFDPHDRYIMGMGSIFTYLYSRDLYWHYVHIVRGDEICPRRKCAEGSGSDLYDTLKEVFKASYVFIDEEGPGAKGKATPEFVKHMDEDERFTKAYIDPDYPSVSVYKF